MAASLPAQSSGPSLVLSSFDSRVFAVPVLPGQVQSSDVHLARSPGMLPIVCPLDLRPLRSTEQPPATGKRLQRILGPEERMLLTQARSLALHVAGVLGVELRDRRPVGGKVPPDAVAPLKLAVGLHRSLEQRRIVPGRAVVDSRRPRRRSHRPELAV